MEDVTVLVVTDTQNDFNDGALGTKEAQETVPEIIKKIVEIGNAHGIILDTKDTHGADYLYTNEGKHLPVAHTVAGTKGWETVPTIDSALKLYGSVSVLKDKFGSVDLASVIRVLVSQRLGKIITTGTGIKIIIIGWCTDICVLVNALLLKTAFPEAEIVVDSKCCAGVTPESHATALTVLRSCQITVI